jgi:hypothetical protein
LTSIGDKTGILYPGISMTKEVYCDFQILNMALFRSYCGNCNVQSRDGGVNKMARKEFIASDSKMDMYSGIRMSVEL